ncbi:IS3 family transposase [Cytobacillus oceanisediminis]|uniref:IS3 family transposase n=1 Tax=Cytobacillus oceanisediminis TaxID=665099 RepID=UPI00373587FC
MKASMSRKGNCWDNACMENFFSHFKTECFYLYSFKAADEVIEALNKYMRFYNHQRFQKKLNNLSPYQYMLLYYCLLDRDHFIAPGSFYLSPIDNDSGCIPRSLNPLLFLLLESLNLAFISL